MKERLIYALVNACREVKCCEVEFCEKHHKECIDKLINCLLADAEGETVKNCHRLKWIPVTERLPEGCKEVLVTDGINIFMPFYCPWDGTFRDAMAGKGFIVQNVTHWMPLPQPPKEGE